MVERIKLFYIGERINPQFKKSYFNAYGRMSKAAARRKEDCLYGSIITTGYNTEKEYLEKIESLKKDGFSVNE